jgi:hypothetical protein
MTTFAMGPYTMDDWWTTPEERLELIGGYFRRPELLAVARLPGAGTGRVGDRGLVA